MPIPTQIHPDWCSIAAAANSLGLSEKTIRRRIADGSIRAHRFGPRLIRVNLNSLHEFGRPLQYIGGDAE